MVISKKLYGFLISILILLSTLGLTTGSVQASPALIKANSEPGQTEDSGVAVAFAQEDPSNYPGPDPLKGEFFDGAVDDTRNDLAAPAVTGDNPDRHEVIGTNQYPVDNRPSGSDSKFQNTETAVPTGGLAGIIYLWLAFAAALAIFSAAVLGAILLYTRQRYKD